MTRATEAATALANARELMARAADDEALGVLDRVASNYDGTASAVESLALSAEIQQRRGQFGAATNAWVGFIGRGGSPERAAEGLLRVADAAARQRSRSADETARIALHELLTRSGSSAHALRALQMKMALEDRLKLKQRDDQFNGTVPASLLTLRDVATKAGTAPVAEYALWRLGAEYKDRKLHALAADTFVDLATRFPNTRYDAWFSAAEIYDRQLKNPARARDAYLKVPAGSSRYRDAQKRARR
jgi:hypothetical protein